MQAQYAADKALLSERRDFDQQAESMRRQHEQSLALLRQKAFREARQIEAHHEHAMAQVRSLGAALALALALALTLTLALALALTFTLTLTLTLTSTLALTLTRFAHAYVP